MNNEITKTTKNKEIIRLHNSFINAIFNLSADAKKLLLVVWLHAKPEESNIVKVYQKDIQEKVGLDIMHLNKEHRESIIEELMKKIVTIRDIKNPNNSIKFSLFRDTEYNNGLLVVDLSPQLSPYIKEAQEKLFTRFKIQNIKPLNSIYAIRLYLLLKQFEDTGWRIMSIDEFREMLDLKYKYLRMYDLKKNVLEIAKKQINENTDIKTDYELIKKGRKYTHIKFFIEKKEKEKKDVSKTSLYSEEKNSKNSEVNNTKTETKNQLPAPTQQAPTQHNDKLEQLKERLKNAKNLNEFRKLILNFGEGLILIYFEKYFHINEIIGGYLKDFFEEKIYTSDNAAIVWGDLFENRDKLEIYLKKEFNFNKFKLKVKKQRLAKFVKDVEKLHKKYNIFPLLLNEPDFKDTYIIGIEKNFDNYLYIEKERSEELITTDKFLFIIQKLGDNKRYYLKYNKNEFLEYVKEKIKEMREQKKEEEKKE